MTAVLCAKPHWLKTYAAIFDTVDGDFRTHHGCRPYKLAYNIYIQLLLSETQTFGSQKWWENRSEEVTILGGKNKGFPGAFSHQPTQL